jgi:serine/threonine protein kinase
VSLIFEAKEATMPPTFADDASAKQPDEIDALARQYLERLKSGKDPDRSGMLRAHPHLGSRLERRLALVEMMYRVGLAPEDEQSTLDETLDAVTFVPSLGLAPTVASETGGAIPPARNPPGYEIFSELGHGGMGVVYKARQISLNRVVALKMIRAHAGPEMLARFHLEAETLASLQHPNIVQICDFGEFEGCPFMAMEFVEGGSLAEFLRSKSQSPRFAAELISTVAQAMHAAHLRGIIHRDLKPANILLQREESSVRAQGIEPPGLSHLSPSSLGSSSLIPKITDFGLAKRLAEEAGRTTTGAIIGTPCYMAPEQARGRVRDIGPAADVYALGAVLYEMLTGSPPFSGETAIETLKRVEREEPVPPSRLCRKLPRDLETICLKCLEKEPAKRYAAAAELAEDLRRFLDGAPIAARPAGFAERAWKWSKRRPALAGLIAVGTAAAVTLAIGWLSWSIQIRAERDRTAHHYQLAREAIDGLYNKMVMERFFDEPQLDPICRELLDKAKSLYQELAQEHAADPALRRDTALAWFHLGDIHRHRDEYSESEAAYREAIARQEALCRDDPGNPSYRQDLANTHNWFGELLRENGRPPDDAKIHYLAAQELQQQLVREYPSEASYRTELARSLYNLAIVERISNKVPAAHENLDRAVDLLNELYEANPSDANPRQDLARALNDRGILLRMKRRAADAARDYNRAIGLLARLHEEYPARAAYKYELAVFRLDRGNLLRSQGALADAQSEHRQALVLLNGLVADFSSRPKYRKKMGNGLKNLGAALASAGDLVAAEQHWNQARNVLAKLSEEYPAVADYHALLGMTYGNLGWLRTEQKNWSEARRFIDEGIAQMRQALESNPDNPDYRRELRNQYRDLAETLLNLGDHAAALEAATNLAECSPELPQYEYYAACFIARCVHLAGKDVKRAQTYIERAVALLLHAAGTATPELKRLSNESHVFRPLQPSPKLQSALRQLDERTKKPVP